METLNGIMMLSKEFFEKSSLHQQISTLAQGTGKVYNERRSYFAY